MDRMCRIQCRCAEIVRVEIEFGKNADDGTIYAKLKDSNMVYKVSSGVNEYFVTDYSTLLPEQTGDTAADE